MVKDLNITLESERALLRPLELDDEKAHQALADDDSLWIFGIQDLSKPEELQQYIRNTVFYSILRSEWNAIKGQYFTNFKAVL